MEKYLKIAFLEILLESSRNPVGILLDSQSPVGIGGGVISTAHLSPGILQDSSWNLTFCWIVDGI